MLAPPLQDPEALMRTPRSNRKSKLKTTANPSQQPFTPNKSPSKRSAAAAVEENIHDQGQVSPFKTGK